jgi:hypothetical protein
LVPTTNQTPPFTADGGPQVGFVVDAFGTFCCVSEVEEQGSGFLITLDPGTSPYTPYLRDELHFTNCVESGGNLILDTGELDADSYPWQFPAADFDPPTFGVNAFAGKTVMYKDGTTDVIVSSSESAAGIIECVMELVNPILSANEIYIGTGFSGALPDYHHTREPHSLFRMYVGEFSLTYSPLWDVRLRDETYAGPWSLLTAGLGGTFGSSGYAPSPLDVVLWADGVHAATGTVTSTTRNTLTDSTAAWTPGEFVGFYLNPNWNQTKLYRILWNDATSVMVDVSGGGVSTVTLAGLHYVILSEKNAARYAGLVNLIQSYLAEDSRCLVKFE